MYPVLLDEFITQFVRDITIEGEKELKADMARARERREIAAREKLKRQRKRDLDERARHSAERARHTAERARRDAERDRLAAERARKAEEDDGCTIL
jgi:hypothetical protein